MSEYTPETRTCEICEKPRSCRYYCEEHHKAVCRGGASPSEHTGPQPITDMERAWMDERAARLAAERRAEEAERRSGEHLSAHLSSFGALAGVSALTDLGGEVDDYEEVVEAVRRLGRGAEAMEAVADAARALDRWFDKGVMHAAPPGNLTEALRMALAALAQEAPEEARHERE